jgi:hypothetical protein
MPETQGMEVFVDGVDNIVEAHQRVARRYVDGGCIEDACPPLRALLHIMAVGSYQDMDVHHPGIRAMFTREYLLESDWYHERLAVKQRNDIALWKRHLQNLQRFLNDVEYSDEAERLGIGKRFDAARKKLAQVQSREYLAGLVGTIGADPLKPACSLSAELSEQNRRVVA